MVRLKYLKIIYPCGHVEVYRRLAPQGEPDEKQKVNHACWVCRKDAE